MPCSPSTMVKFDKSAPRTWYTPGTTSCRPASISSCDIRQRLGLTVSGASALSLMKSAYLERSHTALPLLSLITPLSGNRAIRPRLAFAKSDLSDHGSEAVEFLLNSRVDGDAGLGSPAVCAWATVVARAKASPAALK